MKRRYYFDGFSQSILRKLDLLYHDTVGHTYLSLSLSLMISRIILRDLTEATGLYCLIFSAFTFEAFDGFAAIWHASYIE